MTAGARWRQGGFSLLELMVATAVMALALAMLYRVDAGAVRGVGDLAQQQRAGVLARSVMESRDAVPPAGWREAGQDGGFEWQVSTAPWPTPAGLDVGATALHEVLVTVQWAGRFGPRSVELRTLLPQARPEAGAAAAAARR
jgi:general secretion pathway protein I